jgi:putative aldouronate transport system permease protein
MMGLVVAFQEYNLFQGIMKSPWVGMEHFERLFRDTDFYRLFTNTLKLSAINLFLYFPAPIVLALFINEIRKSWIARTIQTIVYVPHFVSWVVVVSVTVVLFAPSGGTINVLLNSMGLGRLNFLVSADAFPWVYLMQNIWKESGWSAIIFIAALASVDPSLYEAAIMDGANRMKQLLHISLPALTTTIILLFILRLGDILEIGFEHIFLMQNPANLAASDVFDTYIYRVGIQTGQFSYSTAIGLFKSVVGLLLIVTANGIAKKVGREGVF